MSDYSKTTNFTAKDALTPGDPNKIIKGSLFDTEYDNLASVSSTKANKVISGTTNNVVKQSSTGDLVDSGYSFSALAGDTAVTKAEMDILDGATVTTAELNILDGVVATAAEINYLDGVTSNVQTQIDTLTSDKANIASPTLTGVPAAPTAAVDTNTTQIATTAFVIAQHATIVDAVAGNIKNGGHLNEYSGDKTYSSTLQYSFIVPKDGEYRCTAKTWWTSASGGGENMSVVIKRNGTTVNTWTDNASTASVVNHTVDISGWSAGDELQVFVSSTGASANTWHLSTFYIKESIVTSTSPVIYTL